jgi:hypothetical protein
MDMCMGSMGIIIDAFLQGNWHLAGVFTARGAIDFVVL